MQTSAPSSTAAVLDYAAEHPQDAVLRRFRAISIVLFCMLLFGVGGYLLQPDTYRATALLQVQAPTQMADGGAQPEDPSQIPAQQAAAAAGLTSAANVNAAIATLTAQGIPITPAQIAAHVKVDPIKDSRLIRIRFDGASPGDAAAVANAMMSSYSAPPSVGPAQLAQLPTQPQGKLFLPIVGICTGLLVGLFIIAFRWR
jgi:uncharacterized protein involved in exopolysaccharide biosynthesis